MWKRSRDLARSALRRVKAAANFDLLAGTSGVLVGALALHRAFGLPEFLERAARAGGALLAVVRGDRWQRGFGRPGRHEPLLTGLSHGASGVVYAAARLHQAVPDRRWLEAAGTAMAYERRHFEVEAGNWLDLRDLPGRRALWHDRARFAAAWCHGAPGVALARMAAVAAWNDGEARAEALAALQTTAAQVRDELGRDQREFGLCHGLSGNADVLLEAAGGLGDPVEEWGALARRAARAGGDLLASGRGPVFDGRDASTALGLMTGFAGFGYFQLRALDPSTRSPLAI